MTLLGSRLWFLGALFLCRFSLVVVGAMISVFIPGCVVGGFVERIIVDVVTFGAVIVDRGLIGVDWVVFIVIALVSVSTLVSMEFVI